MLGLGVARLEDDMNRLIALLFHQGVLDEQFMQLRQLQDESAPNFVSEVISIYFRESDKLLKNIRVLLLAGRESTDYVKIETYTRKLIGSSSSIGAKRVRTICIAFRNACEQGDLSRSKRSFAMLEHEYLYLKDKLHEILQLEQQRVIAAGVRYHPAMMEA